MTDLVNSIIFEHPLSEKTRTALRLEYLLCQVKAQKVIRCTASALAFFRPICDILDIIERGDVRADLVKEMTRQQQKLLTWLDVPGVDTERVHATRHKLQNLISQLIAVIRVAQGLKDDRFVTSIRQRLAIPGGCCSFDLPTLHLWLNIPQEERNIQASEWLSQLSLLDESINICIKLLRQSGTFHQYSCSANFYQESSDAVDLLRIRIPKVPRVYPQVSGNRNRYAIRFVPFNSKIDILPEEYHFELACC